MKRLLDPLTSKILGFPSVTATPSKPTENMKSTLLTSLPRVCGLAAGLFALSASPAKAVLLFTDFGDVGGQVGLQSSPSASSSLTGGVTAVTLNYDISGQGLGGTATTLQLIATSTVGRNFNAGGNNGIAVLGSNGSAGGGTVGQNNSWWQTGEDIAFTLTMRDASNADVTSLYSVDLTGAEIRWRDTGGTVIISGNTVTAATTAMVGADFVYYTDFATGQTAETSFTAARGLTAADNDVAQLAGLQFNVAAVPEPTTIAFLIFGGIALCAIQFRRRAQA